MEWPAAQETWKNDEWLKQIFFGQNKSLLSDVEVQKNWVESNLWYVRTLPFQGLNPDWRDVSVQMVAQSSPVPTRYNEHQDVVAHYIKHYLVCRLSMPDQLAVMSMSPGKGARFGYRSIRQQLSQKHCHFGRYNGHYRRGVNWIAAVRNISLISQGEYVMNGYEIYRFPTDFDPFNFCWGLQHQFKTVNV